MGRRQRDYLHQRPGSSIWRLRLQIAGESDRVISLRTTDRIEAEILAMPLILEHKKRLWARANQRARRYMLVESSPRMQPGDYPQPDGSRIHCTGNTILIFDAGGQFISQRPNAPQTSLTQDLDPAEISPSGAPMLELVDPEKPLFLAESLFTIHTRLKPKTNPAQADTTLLELWIKV